MNSILNWPGLLVDQIGFDGESVTTRWHPKHHFFWETFVKVVG
jgi:hypothetical protein